MLTGATPTAPQTGPGTPASSNSGVRAPRHTAAPMNDVGKAPMPDDGTRQLLIAGFWTLVVGLAAAAAIRLVFGGMGVHGPHTNGGWLSLILALMCLPFGTMLLLLGGAKYLRNRRLARR